jgi:hypothetical protein
LYLVWLTNEAPGVPLWLGSALYLPALLMLIWERWKLRNQTVSA